MADDPSAGDEIGAPELPAPLGFTGVAKNAWRLYREHLGALLGLYLIVQLGLFLLALGLEVLDAYVALSIQLRSLIFMVQITSNAVAGSFAAAITAAFLIDRIAGREISISDTWSSLRSNARDLLTAGLLASVLALALVLFLIDLDVLLMPILFGPPVVAQVLAVERLKLQQGWPRARELGAREWGRVIMYLVTLALTVALVVNLVLYGVGVGISGLSIQGDAIETVAGIAFGLVLPHLLFALGWPLISVAQAVVYLDLRARKEELTHPKLVVERAKLGPASSDADPSPD